MNLPAPPIKLLSANVGPGMPSLPANGQIELAFDRLLLPTSMTRQTFVLENAGGTAGFTPEITYDPVSRVVTIAPLADQPLLAGQDYRLFINTPMNASDPNGLRAIDGATLDPSVKSPILFAVTAAGASVTAPPMIDYCRDIAPIFNFSCTNTATCHVGGAGSTPGQGLILDSPADVQKTAIGFAAHEANTGPRSVAAPPSHLFVEDMPIIDSMSDSANSYLLYKLLLAEPTAAPPPTNTNTEVDAGTTNSEAGTANADAGAADGSAGLADASLADGGSVDAATPITRPKATPPVDVTHAYQVMWTGISDDERAILSNYIIGREMPFPPTGALNLDQLERLNFWISQGAMLPTSKCP